MVLYERIYFQFREINSEKFSQLTYYDIDKQDDLKLYCKDGVIVKFENTFFQCKQKSRIASSPKGIDPEIEIKRKGDNQQRKLRQNIICPEDPSKKGKRLSQK